MNFCCSQFERAISKCTDDELNGSAIHVRYGKAWLGVIENGEINFCPYCGKKINKTKLPKENELQS